MEIIGGREVSPHSRPFMASIQYGATHICGGVLIHPQWVLTAAHCHPRWVPTLSACVFSLKSARREAYLSRERIGSMVYFCDNWPTGGVCLPSRTSCFLPWVFLFGESRSTCLRQAVRQTRAARETPAHAARVITAAAVVLTLWGHAAREQIRPPEFASPFPNFANES